MNNLKMKQLLATLQKVIKVDQCIETRSYKHALYYISDPMHAADSIDQ